jgi:feruloyl esterase
MRRTIAISAFLTLPLGAATCEGLGTLALAHTRIHTAALMKGAVGPNSRPLPDHCRVTATLAPSNDSEIKIEVWMPLAGWNNNLQSVGNGAWAGTISYPAMATALSSGYATASTDTGHTGNTADFILQHPEKVTDFAYRAVHEMTVAAKAIVSAYYGKPPLHSYWNGCSTGGRQALTEAQRYPGDYDGIIAGAAANYVTHLQGAQVWTTQLMHKSEAAYIPPAKYRMLHDAVLAACDALDGVKDGVLEDPTRCHFDPKDLECKAGDAPSCLTPPQVEAARKTYLGPVDGHGTSLFPGLERGSETGWATLSGPKPMSLADETYKLLVFKNPNWDYLTLDASRDFANADKVAGTLMNAIDPNLKPLFARGGKVLMYHGWADPGIAPRNSVNYYESVLKANGGPRKASDSIRLFMVPGMGHCRGGDGTDTFDAVSMLDQWVANGKAPDRLEASHSANGVVDKTRPLCPYPQTAVYSGAGSTNQSANFICKAPQP